MLSLLAILQNNTPGDCLLTGLCGLVQDRPPFAPGVMWVSVGLVMAGVWGLRRVRHRP